MANKRVQILRSSVSGKAPTSLEYGELAINYCAGEEKLYIKNSEDKIVHVSINSSVEDSLKSHIADTNNPHSVTKSQVGLGKVDNTTDLEKPLSTAQQTALDAKLNSSDVIDNCETSASDKALSANQGIYLLELANSASGGITSDLSSLLARIANCEEEIDNMSATEDTIIAREDEIIAEFAV